MNENNKPRSDNLEAEKPQAPAEQRTMQHPSDKIGFQGTDQSGEKKPTGAVAANDASNGPAASRSTAQQPDKAAPQGTPQKRP